jgi:16S rRNA (guanine1207-N2)-methyltransferase
MHIKNPVYPKMAKDKPIDLQQLRNDLTIQAVSRNHPISFKTTWGLFSPKAIDEGSKLLLDHIDINSDDDSLDVGCGYGILGLTIAKEAPQGKATLIDKDFVAVEYTQKNIALNKLTNAESFLSNGFNQIGQRKFDLIVSNLPAKVGNEMLTLYMHDAFSHLNPGGRFYVVNITGMRDFIKREFKTVFGNFKKMKQGKTYTVSRAIKED